MPRIKRWFPVSHDINSDPEVIELTDKFGLTGLKVWLECLSIADRNEGELAKDLDSLARSLSLKCGSTKSRVRLVLDSIMTRTWLEHDSTVRVRNYLKYHRTWEQKPFPSEPDLTRPDRTYPKEDKKKIASQRKNTLTPPTPKLWPDDDIWLKELLSNQWFLNHCNGDIADYSWWENVAVAVNGLDRGFVEPEFAKISAWLRENPNRKPTVRGMRRFLRTWLERAKNQRRLYVAK